MNITPSLPLYRYALFRFHGPVEIFETDLFRIVAQQQLEDCFIRRKIKSLEFYHNVTKVFRAPSLRIDIDTDTLVAVVKAQDMLSVKPVIRAVYDQSTVFIKGPAPRQQMPRVFTKHHDLFKRILLKTHFLNLTKLRESVPQEQRQKEKVAHRRLLVRRNDIADVLDVVVLDVLVNLVRFGQKQLIDLAVDLIFVDEFAQ